MRSSMVGLWHVRGGPVATLLVVLMLALVVVQPHFVIEVHAIYAEPGRGLGVFELAAIVLASTLPALTAPSFDARERFVYGLPRITHTAVTLAAFLAPLLILPVWSWRIHLDPTAEAPPAIGFGGNLILYSTIGMIVLLLLGRTASVVATPLLCIGFIVAQQALPGTILTTWWATRTRELIWHSNWTVAALLTLLVTALTWTRGSVPRH